MKDHVIVTFVVVQEGGGHGLGTSFSRGQKKRFEREEEKGKSMET